MVSELKITASRRFGGEAFYQFTDRKGQKYTSDDLSARGYKLFYVDSCNVQLLKGVKMRWSNVNLMGLLLLSASAFSQPVEMNNTPVKEFVSWYAKSTGKPIVISPDVTGTINVFLPMCQMNSYRPFLHPYCGPMDLTSHREILPLLLK
ncbi:hypothetical protein [Dickeya fangzhongdai]|uniref:hypothetical protein n=1 Tax=Dickeya fangzhongdai TaxID=1778540 RepID=UPI0026E05352|nr:hypothetical protein [Dickeya fangzhongdai]WKV51046.1 hypothetical protein PL145_01870 [Dickeya fangzhongdai]